MFGIILSILKIIGIILLILLGKNDYNYVSLWKKAMLILVFLSFTKSHTK